MPQGQSWFDRIFSAPPSSQGLPALSQTPLEQTNPGLAKLRDLIGGFIGSQDALTPTSSGATLTGAAMASLIPLAGVLKMGQGEQAAVKGIKAYHGSPHDFDKFSMQKIGTGEGAQAYGHGLYFAENPKWPLTIVKVSPVRRRIIRYGGYVVSQLLQELTSISLRLR